MPGLIQVYTGDGKGKTTAAFGQALRAAGRGLQVAIVQFFKNRDTGEVTAIREALPLINIHRCHTQRKFIWDMNELEQATMQRESVAGFEKVSAAAGNYDLLILDEIAYPLKYKHILIEDFTTWLKAKPEALEIVLTGRDFPESILLLADLVTEMKKIKHPFDKGIGQRKGIEF